MSSFKSYSGLGESRGLNSSVLSTVNNLSHDCDANHTYKNRRNESQTV